MQIPTTNAALVDPRYGVLPRGAAGPPDSGTAVMAPLVKEPASFNVLSAMMALVLCIAIAVAIRLVSDDSSHWFVVPVVACGVICAIDVVDWLRGRVDTFDPVAIVGIGGLHFFMTAPLLHVCWNLYLGNTDIIHPPEWRDWLGGMAILNFLGLVAYRVVRAYSDRRSARRRIARKVWIIDPNKFRNAIWPAMLLTALLQIYVYASFGGIGGYISEYESISQKRHSSRNHEAAPIAFVGFGTSFTISESFPILAMMAYAVYMRRRGKKISWPTFFAVMAIYLVLKIFFGGLRGSRSETMFAMTFAAGMVHFYLRAIPKKIFLVGLCLMVVYLYVYGFYKNGGRAGIRALMDSEARGRISKKIGRSYVSILLGDLARADIQAHLLYRFMDPIATLTMIMAAPIGAVRSFSFHELSGATDQMPSTACLQRPNMARARTIRKITAHRTLQEWRARPCSTSDLMPYLSSLFRLRFL